MEMPEILKVMNGYFRNIKIRKMIEEKKPIYFFIGKEDFEKYCMYVRELSRGVHNYGFDLRVGLDGVYLYENNYKKKRIDCLFYMNYEIRPYKGIFRMNNLIIPVLGKGCDEVYLSEAGVCKSM